MSKYRCPYCESDQLSKANMVTWICGMCQRYFREGEAIEDTIFHQITKDEETLATKLVYHDEEHEIAFSVVIRGVEQRMGHECWRSTIIPGACWAEYDRAYAATVAKLKEVE